MVRNSLYLYCHNLEKAMNATPKSSHLAQFSKIVRYFQLFKTLRKIIASGINIKIPLNSEKNICF